MGLRAWLTAAFVKRDRVHHLVGRIRIGGDYSLKFVKHGGQPLLARAAGTEVAEHALPVVGRIGLVEETGNGLIARARGLGLAGHRAQEFAKGLRLPRQAVKTAPGLRVTPERLTDRGRQLLAAGAHHRVFLERLF